MSIKRRYLAAERWVVLLILHGVYRLMVRTGILDRIMTWAREGHEGRR